MNVIVDFTIVPIGAGISISEYVAACQNIINKTELKSTLHANGTNIEGNWDEVFGVIKKCHEIVHEMGAPRIFTVIKAGTRTDREQTMNEKLLSVKKRMTKK